MTPDASRLLTVAVDIATEAADRLRAGRPEGRVPVAATKSSPTDAVTEYDTAVQRLVQERLAQRRPDDGLLGEEGLNEPGRSGVVWVVDPIDGTVNFVYGLPAYAVSVAAQVDGQSVAGCVVDVASGEAFAAARGHGATRRPAGGEPRPLRVPPAPPLREALVATGFSYDVETRRRQAAAVSCLLTEVRDIRRVGAASLDLCAVAAGRVDAFVEEGLQPWDLAAGGLVAEEAGAVLVGHGDRPPGPRLVLATLPDLLDPLRAVVSRCGF